MEIKAKFNEVKDNTGAFLKRNKVKIGVGVGVTVGGLLVWKNKDVLKDAGHALKEGLKTKYPLEDIEITIPLSDITDGEG